MPDNHTRQEQSDQSNTSSDLSPFKVLTLTLLMLETVIGTLVNGYIVLVNLIDLVTMRKLGSGDIILACLSLSRFGFQFLVLGLYVLSLFYSDYAKSQDTVNNLQYVWLFFHNFSVWLAALLCTFYCVRIVSIQQCVFAFLKTHFDKCVPWLILVTATISSICSNSFAYNGITHVFNMSKLDRSNWSSPFVLGGSDFATFSIVSGIGTVPPFVLFCVSSGLVVGSLLRHTSRVKGQERTGFREPSLNAHYRAVRMMAFFFLFFLFYMIAFNLYVSDLVGSGIWGCLCSVVIGAYPSLHSLVLAIGNTKLKLTFMKILHKAHCYQGEMTQIETIDS